MRRSWPLTLILCSAALSGAALSACATRDPMTAPPDWMDIRILEELRVIAPLASSTETYGTFTVENAPKVDTRNVRCTPGEDDTYTCSFEARVVPKGAKPPPWEKRTELMERDSRGNWWFAKPRSGA